ncbi:AraC family transcriptional regulator [Dyadobacter psychrotolerans]|uniref:Helix-turn-helix domain-containing protein n=1 Tax=Dyadobacter psychrotolerans TaxID=2541721 RepID=A0A4V2Z4B0_9BACT|nr:helix-turn-helix domain-containing protein [Dyadobacter psychrotolerans]TDE15468.1 helix-turn-helix domain-containing protein [Dyadobacter psychrotolerans]
MSNKTQQFPQLDICTLSESRKENLMVSRLSDYLQEHQNLVFPHRHSFYHLVLFTKGAGVHTIDFQQFDVRKSQIYFMVPAQVHAWFFKGEMEGYVINFSDTFFQSFLLRPDYLETFSFFNGSTTECVVDLTEALMETIVALFEQIIEQSQPDHVLQEDMIRSLLLQIFIRTEQSRINLESKVVQNKPTSLIRNFQKLIDQNFVALRLPGEYAELLNITPNHLNALTKEHLGKQAGEVIRERIILESKRLLINLDLTVSEIAYKLNFNDNSYFTKFFRKYTGLAPEDFRKKSVHQKN